MSNLEQMTEWQVLSQMLKKIKEIKNPAKEIYKEFYKAVKEYKEKYRMNFDYMNKPK